MKSKELQSDYDSALRVIGSKTIQGQAWYGTLVPLHTLARNADILKIKLNSRGTGERGNQNKNKLPL